MADSCWCMEKTIQNWKAIILQLKRKKNFKEKKIKQKTIRQT